jgi:hypothetical protein
LALVIVVLESKGCNLIRRAVGWGGLHLEESKLLVTSVISSDPGVLSAWNHGYLNFPFSFELLEKISLLRLSSFFLLLKLQDLKLELGNLFLVTSFLVLKRSFFVI